MRIGILGTGVVGQTIETRLVQLGHDVMLGARAKAQVTDLLRSFGWRTVIDLGDISTARGAEMILPLWLRLMGALKTPVMSFHIAR